MFWRKLQFDKNTYLAKYILKSGKYVLVFSRVTKDLLQFMKMITSPRNEGITLFCNVHLGKQEGTYPFKTSIVRDPSPSQMCPSPSATIKTHGKN